MNTTPIEFMAWDTRHNKLFDVEAVYTDQVDYKDDGDTKFDAYMPQYGYQSRGEVYLMQLTALRSINNEPIYNHMIVKARHEEYAYEKYYAVDMFNYKVMAYLSDCSLEIVGNRFSGTASFWSCANER